MQLKYLNTTTKTLSTKNDLEENITADTIF